MVAVLLFPTFNHSRDLLHRSSLARLMHVLG